MKQFKCASLVPGCDWHTRNDDEAEIVRRATDHLRKAHGEKVIRPEMIENIKARISEAESIR